MAPKKDKGKSMSLADFTKTFVAEGAPAAAASGSWADDDFALPSAPAGVERPLGPRGLPAGPAAVDEDAIPHAPPYVAFVGNLSFDATDDSLRAFFAGVSSVRFPPPGPNGPRGFAYVEFTSRDGLRAALMRSGEAICGRPCRVDVSTGGSRRDGPPPGIVGGNWRDGAGRVVESSRPSAFGSGTGAPRGNWRESSSAPLGGAAAVGFEPAAPVAGRDSSSASRIDALAARDAATRGRPARSERAAPAAPRPIMRPATAELVVPVPERKTSWRPGDAAPESSTPDAEKKAWRAAEPAPVAEKKAWRAAQPAAPAASPAAPAQATRPPKDKYALPAEARSGNWRVRADDKGGAAS